MQNNIFFIFGIKIIREINTMLIINESKKIIKTDKILFIVLNIMYLFKIINIGLCKKKMPRLAFDIFVKRLLVLLFNVGNLRNNSKMKIEQNNNPIKLYQTL